MAKKYRARLTREERSTGKGGAELTESESLLAELIDLEDEIERQVESENEEKQHRMEQERGQALEMRQRAMERFGQTRKRAGQANEDGKEKKRRRSGEMMKWLQERIELEKEKGRQSGRKKHNIRRCREYSMRI